MFTVLTDEDHASQQLRIVKLGDGALSVLQSQFFSKAQEEKATKFNFTDAILS